LKEKRISFKGLTNAWNRTHEELVSGIWDKKHTVSYFSVQFLEDKKELFPIEYCVISLLKENFPAKYQMLPIPVLWNRGNDLDIHIDVTMHLLLWGLQNQLYARFKHGVLCGVVPMISRNMSLVSWKLSMVLDCHGLYVFLILEPNLVVGFRKTTWIWLGSRVGSIKKYLLL
jgi:hypothetical protein